MPFLIHLSIAIVILVIGLLMKALSPAGSVGGDVYFLLGTLGAQLWLFIAAIQLRAKDLPRFDMLVAAELIIALGILSLILGIISAVFFAFHDVAVNAGFTPEVLRPLLSPFAVGLFAAGVAPVLATTLRQIEVLKYSGAKEGESTPETELEGLRAGIREATVVLGNFTAACQRSQAVFEKSATSFNKSAATYEAATVRIETALRHLADVAGAEAGRVAASLEAMTKNISIYEKKVALAAHEMGTLTDATVRFRTAAEEGATLVGGLQKVIDSVERFIHPDRS